MKKSCEASLEPMVLQHSSVGNPYIGINLLCHANVGISDRAMLQYHWL